MKHLQNVPVRAVNVQVFLFFFSVKRIWLVTVTTLSMRVSEHNGYPAVNHRPVQEK